jgi:hypothetical protein
MGTHDNVFLAVTAISGSDVWAVGYYYTGTIGLTGLTLTEHWDGISWSVVTSPNVGTLQNGLFGVAGISSTDMWAVGYYLSANGTPDQTLVEHWNGTSWEVVNSPNESTHDNFLRGVAPISSNDVWAVGYYDTGNGTPDQTLVEHWDGFTWSVVPSPNVGTFDRLYGVAAVSSSDVWAVGTAGQTLVEHWDGSTWSVVPSPNVGTFDYLYGVAALSSSDVWAVGWYDIGTTDQTLVEHWNGSTWSVVSSPDVGTMRNYLYGVAAVSSSNIWAAGYYLNGTVGRTLVEHWDGSTWSVVSSPDVGPYTNDLNGVAAVSANDVWAVGDYINGTTAQTLVERYNPCLPSPTPTLTSPPTSTPSACSIQYTDVPMDSTFYPYIHCLSCLGIVSGYPDDTFRPNNPVTRGQLSKIVSNSAGYSETHTETSFQDVSADSTFYQYIERLATRAFISGYDCGTNDNEPCIPPDNLPYFRPNNNVTRGQTSKIVAQAAGLPAPPSGQQSFQDVPEGSTFWQWIEALATAGTISGYPCGGDNEPCVPPDNLPYFRPNNDVTRGQSTKIVGNTFFPNCQPPQTPSGGT